MTKQTWTIDLAIPSHITQCSAILTAIEDAEAELFKQADMIKQGCKTATLTLEVESDGRSCVRDVDWSRNIPDRCHGVYGRWKGE